MSAIDDLLSRDRDRGTPAAPLPGPPSSGVAVVACMDARLDVYRVLGLRPGEAHVIRNAGGIVTDDVIRSLAISQRLLGTSEIVLIHHTRCGMLTVSDEGFRQQLRDEVGTEPAWSAGGFTDLDDDVRTSMTRIADDPFLVHRDAVRGFVYDVDAGTLREIVPG